MTSRTLALIDAVATRRPSSPRREPNIGLTERAASAAVGAALLGWALSRRSVGGVAAGLLGGGLLYRGARGRSRLYEVVGVSTAAPAEPVERVVTVNRSPAEVYAFCRDFRNLARIIPEALAISVAEPGRLRWILATPTEGARTWEASVVADTPNEVVAWRGPDGPSGRFMFRHAAGQRGAEVHLQLDAAPTAVDESLRRLKQLVEAGEIPTTAGQPQGRGV